MPSFEQSDNETTPLVALGCDLHNNENNGGVAGSSAPLSRPSASLLASFAVGMMMIMATFLLPHVPKHSTTMTTTWMTASSAVVSDDATMMSSKSPYTRVQGIGFQIYTGGAPAFLQSNSDEQQLQHKNSTSQKTLNPECLGSARYGQMIGDETEGKPDELQCYLGMENATQDAQHRLKIMQDAVETAYSQAETDPTVLKIFVAPEFYWRGADGAYEFSAEGPGDASICGPVCQILHGLEIFVAQERFADWIFLFGTVTAWERLNSDKNNKADDTSDYLFYNFAPMYKGYDPATTTGHGPRFIVPKRYVSSSDFLTPARHLHPSQVKELIELGKQDRLRIVKNERPAQDGGVRTAVLNPHDLSITRYHNAMWKEYKHELDELGYTMIEYDWLMLDDLALTVEICLDHQMRTALTTYLADLATGRRTRIPRITTQHRGSSSTFAVDNVPIPTAQADISLVASAGMTFAPDALALTDQGVGFLQDGLSNETNFMAIGSDADACDVSGWEFHGGTEAIQRRAFLSPTDIVWEHSSLGAFRKFPLHDRDDNSTWQDFLNGVFSTKVYRPHVVVFDPVKIPNR